MIPNSSHRRNPILEAARRYSREGLFPLPVAHKDKGVISRNGFSAKGWQKAELSAEQIESVFGSEEPLNIGIRTAGSLVDIDLDDKLAVALAPRFLPPTSTFGHGPDKHNSHWIYTSADIDFYHALKFGTDTLVEIRADAGHQTVFPPSTHKNGYPVEWDNKAKGYAPAQISRPELFRKQIVWLAICALVARYWTEGGRHGLALPFAGVIARHFEHKAARAWGEVMVRAIANVTGDDEVELRVAAVKTTFDKRDNGENFTGLPELAKVIGGSEGEKVTATIQSWLKWLGGDRLIPADTVPFEEIREADAPQPEPLGASPGKAKPFPVDALPDIMRKAVVEYQEYAGQDIAIPASTALGAMSVSVQGLANIARDKQLSSPLSLALITVAKSSERKSSCDKMFRRGLMQWLASVQEQVGPVIKERKGEIAAWESAVRGLKAKIQNENKGQGNREIIDRCSKALVELYREEPRELIVPELFYSDATQQALIKFLEKGLPDGAVWEDDAGLLFGSHAMNDKNFQQHTVTLLKLRDGDGVKALRTSVDNREVRPDTRVTIYLMAQPQVIRKFFGAYDGLARENGLLSRVLMCHPPSTIGSRMYTPPKKGGLPDLDKLNDRYRELISSANPLVNGYVEVRELPTLRLSTEATNEWTDYHDQVEEDSAPMGEFASIADFAGKSADNQSRIAGGFHLVDGQRVDQEVSKEHSEQASTVARFFLEDTKRILDAYETPESIADADALLRWMIEKGWEEYTPEKIAQQAPTRELRKSRPRRIAALEELTQRHIVFKVIRGRATLYTLSPRAEDAVL